MPVLCADLLAYLFSFTLCLRSLARSPAPAPRLPDLPKRAHARPARLGRPGELGSGLPPLPSSVKDGGRLGRLRRATLRRRRNRRRSKGLHEIWMAYSAGQFRPLALRSVTTLATFCPVKSKQTVAATRRSCRPGRRHRRHQRARRPRRVRHHCCNVVCEEANAGVKESVRSSVKLMSAT